MTKPTNGLTMYQVSAWSDVNCRRSYLEIKSLQMDGRSNILGLGATSMFNFHRDLRVIPKGLGACLMYF